MRYKIKQRVASSAGGLLSGSESHRPRVRETLVSCPSPIGRGIEEESLGNSE